LVPEIASPTQSNFFDLLFLTSSTSYLRPPPSPQLIERMCVVTPIAMRIKISLTMRMWIRKTAEYPIVTHNNEMDKIFAFGGIPFPS